MGSRIALEAKVHGAWYRVFDDLSSYFLCSNDSNDMRVGRKLIKGMGMHGKLAHENGVCVRAWVSPVDSERSEVKTRTLKTAGMPHPPSKPTARNSPLL